MENYFKFSTPEACGVQSPHIGAFLDRLEEKNYTMHSYLMARHGHIFAEGYFAPFRQSDFHRMFSISKTFVSTAVGLLQDEGRLSLSDPIVRFFPDKLPKNLHPYLKSATIRDLLMMATPYDGGATYSPKDPDWGDTFFRARTTHDPGTVFHYDTTATTMLCMIIRRVSGQDFVDYLRPRLFRQIGISEEVDCIRTPCGYQWGGSGVLCTSRDLARFATVCVDGGCHNGEQLIPAWYLQQATAKQIDTVITAPDPEQQFGYGYQFWRTRHDGFATLGMGCQMSANLPQYRFSMVTTGDTQGRSRTYGAVYDGLWDLIYPHLEAGKHYKPDPDAQKEIEACIAGLTLPAVCGEASDPVAAQVSGRRWRMEENPMGITEISFTFMGDEGRMEYTNRTGRHTLRFGMCHQVTDHFPETSYFGMQIGTPYGKGYVCQTSAAFAVPGTLLLRCYATDLYFGSVRMNAAFRGNRITLEMQKNAEWFFDEYQGFASGELIENE